MSNGARYLYKTITAQKNGPVISEQLTPFPTSVQPAAMLDYLIDIYGEPTDEAVTDTDDFGRLMIGLVFRAPHGDDTDPPTELIAIPMIEDPDDPENLISMFLYQEQLRRNFVTTMTDAGIEVETVEAD